MSVNPKYGVSFQLFILDTYMCIQSSQELLDSLKNVNQQLPKSIIWLFSWLKNTINMEIP